MKRLWKYLYAAAFCIILTLAGASALARDAIDFSRDGNSSIEVIVKSEKKPVEGALISLYQVQSYDSQRGFYWNPEYEECGIEVEGLTASELAKAAEQLADYIKKNKLSGIQQTTDAEGKTVFKNLKFGLYLAVWDGNPKNIKAISPVLLSVPIEEGDGYLYDITIKPKVVVRKTETPQDTPQEESEEEIVSTPVVKKDPQPSEPESEEETIVEASSIDLTSIDGDTAKGNRKFPQTGAERWRIFLLAGVGIVVFAVGVCIGWSRAKKRQWLSGVLMGAGVVCLIVTGFNLVSEYRQEQEVSQLTDEILEQYEERYFEHAEEQTFEEEYSGIEIDGELYDGVLSIPAIGITLPVNMELSYEQLRQTPCRYRGDAAESTMVIAAHNYARHFGNISSLRAGDKVSYVDSNGEEYHYEVSDSEILGAYDVDKLDEGDWDLTLLTCTYGGASRILVRCKKINS